MVAKKIQHLNFYPLLGITSYHFQMFLHYILPNGQPPPSHHYFVSLDDGDTLCCEMSTPSSWQPYKKTVLLIHGLSGSENSDYMIRISRKLYKNGHRVLRVNMRGCGSGANLARRFYNGGNSHDILNILQKLKSETPLSSIYVVGFSVGGNVALKLAGELGEQAKHFIKQTIAICPCIDLVNSQRLLSSEKNQYYNQFFMDRLKKHTYRWTKHQNFTNMLELDNALTAPAWGFEDALEYYQKSSSCFLLPKISHPCHLLFSLDDPFIDYKECLKYPLNDDVKIWFTDFGAHLASIGTSKKSKGIFWLDWLITQWIEDKDVNN